MNQEANMLNQGANGVNEGMEKKAGVVVKKAKRVAVQFGPPDREAIERAMAMSRQQAGPAKVSESRLSWGRPPESAVAAAMAAMKNGPGAQQVVNGAQVSGAAAQQVVNGAQQVVNGAQVSGAAAQQVVTGVPVGGFTAQQLMNGASTGGVVVQANGVVVQEAKVVKPRRQKKANPELARRARELRDRYLEQVNAQAGEAARAALGGKYEVDRVIESAEVSKLLAA